MADVAAGYIRSTDDGSALFLRWHDAGLWSKINHAFLMLARVNLDREASPTAGIIDSQSVKTTEGGDPRGYATG